MKRNMFMIMALIAVFSVTSFAQKPQIIKTYNGYANVEMWDKNFERKINVKPLIIESSKALKDFTHRIPTKLKLIKGMKTRKNTDSLLTDKIDFKNYMLVVMLDSSIYSKVKKKITIFHYKGGKELRINYRWDQGMIGQQPVGLGQYHAILLKKHKDRVTVRSEKNWKEYASVR